MVNIAKGTRSVNKGLNTRSSAVKSAVLQNSLALKETSPVISPEIAEGQFAFSEAPGYGLVGSSIIATQKLSEQKQAELERIYAGAVPTGKNWVKVPHITNEARNLRHIRGKEARYELASLGLAVGASPDDIAGCFKDSVNYYSNSSLVYERQTEGEGYKKGDKVAFPMRSRWNFRDRAWYSKKFFSIKRAIKPHRAVTMVTLTYAPELLSVCKDADNYGGDIYSYALSRVWQDIKRFKDRLYRYTERELWAKHKARRASHYQGCVERGELTPGEARQALKYERVRFKNTLKTRLWWSHLATVLEFQGQGIVHVHMVFKGNWVAPVNKESEQKSLTEGRVFTPGNLVDMWGMSAPQGVDITSSKDYQQAFRPERYISSYFKKALQAVKGEYVNLPYAYAYFFSVRFYNIAHNSKALAKESSNEPQAWLAIGSAYTCGRDWLDGDSFRLFGKYRGFDDIKEHLYYIEQDNAQGSDNSMSQLYGGELWL